MPAVKRQYIVSSIEINPWMFCRQDVSLFCHGNMGVDFACMYGTVTGHCLYIAYIEICLKKHRSKGMTPYKGDVLLYGSKPRIIIEHPSYGLILKWTSLLIGKKNPHFDISSKNSSLI